MNHLYYLEGFLQDPYKLVNRVNSLLEDSSDWYTAVRKIDEDKEK